jgi:hypothetical protein
MVLSVDTPVPTEVVGRLVERMDDAYLVGAD